eukprot:GHVH01016933.1.p3 GENE.GHVH01016933.1~~GHVH01016933.1.p3  ORF type:complete len:105 (-),score=8.74 GHVH01016933.1:1069-1383(-)
MREKCMCAGVESLGGIWSQVGLQVPLLCGDVWGQGAVGASGLAERWPFRQLRLVAKTRETGQSYREGLVAERWPFRQLRLVAKTRETGQSYSGGLVAEMREEWK